MNVARREFVVGLGTSALLGLGGCSQASKMRVLGRYAVNPDGGFRFAWPASGVEGRCFARQAIATIEDNGRNLMDVTIDGETTTLKLEPGVHDYVLFNSDARAQHTIKLTRKSEIFDDGITTIRDFRADMGWRELPAFSHRMLVLGDSLSVGYGALGADETCHYSAETGAPLQSYASLTANAFNAELHLIAISGRGVIRNWDDSEPPRMPWQIDKALPDQAEPLWDQSLFQPELVVINLGTNDFSQGYPGQRFDDGYVDMLNKLRTAYPQARIIAAFGPDAKEGAPAAIQRALDVFNRDETVPAPYLFLDKAPSGHVWGCDYHPGLDSHRVMAETLIAFIENDLGWRRV